MLGRKPGLEPVEALDVRMETELCCASPLFTRRSRDAGTGATAAKSVERLFALVEPGGAGEATRDCCWVRLSTLL